MRFYFLRRLTLILMQFSPFPNFIFPLHFLFHISQKSYFAKKLEETGESMNNLMW